MANPDPKRVAIGSLRWPVTIALRQQTAAGTATIAEAYTEMARVRADVQPLGPMTYLAGIQTDRPITHKITIRWLDWVDERHVILRATLREDGTLRTETFRIRRLKEIDGRQRFLEIEAELERRD